MAWVTWRHHRIALSGVIAFLGALAVWLYTAGLQLHHAYAAAAACHPASSAACLNQIVTFEGTNLVLKYALVLQPVPALIGAFIGAPLLAREMETGTFRYAWTQGFGRWRWALAKLVMVGVAVTVVAGAFSVLVSWYYQPYVAAGNRAQFSVPSVLSPGLFDVRGVDFAAWTLAAFAIGALAGMLIRRVVPAIVATLAAYCGLALIAGNLLRPHYMAALVAKNANIPGSALINSEWWTKGGKFAFGGQAPLDLLPQLCPSDRSRLAPAAQEQVSSPVSPVTVLSPRRSVSSNTATPMGQLPAGQPLLAVPMDRGGLVARPVGAAHRRNRLARPPSSSMNRSGVRPKMRERGHPVRRVSLILVALVVIGIAIASGGHCVVATVSSHRER